MNKKISKVEFTQIAKEVISIEIDSLIRLRSMVDENFNKAVAKILGCKGKVIVTGLGKSGIIGKKITATMCSLGTVAVFLNPVEALHGDSGLIKKEDLIIAISNSGETQEILNLISVLRDLKVPIIALTGKKDSQLGRNSDIVLDISVEREADYLNLAPTSSCVTTLAVGDALAVAVAKAKGFDREDFARFHPGGKLGQIAKT